MKHFEDKKQIKSRFYSRYTIVGLAIVIVLLGNGVWNIYMRERQSRVMRREAETRLENTLNQKRILEEETGKLQSEEGIEEEIRTKFNVIKPGEHVVMIVNPEATTSATTTQGFWARLWAKVW